MDRNEAQGYLKRALENAEVNARLALNMFDRGTNRDNTALENGDDTAAATCYHLDIIYDWGDSRCLALRDFWTVETYNSLED